ncbi:SymE family type I addiction module toxin [Pantoea piersonii]|uniref:hypothetical protein n=1 Tax=Pantoea piersonii TaxID=2364647 RepID=UPI0022F1A2A3|nr:hypothetical protein [Pantoea piersonii]WBV23392.1 hypothetical protein PG877_04380 [Pantoea piersonii]
MSSLPLPLCTITPLVRKSVVDYRTNGGRPNPLSKLTIKERLLEPPGFTTGQKIEVSTELGQPIIRMVLED